MQDCCLFLHKLTKCMQDMASLSYLHWWVWYRLYKSWMRVLCEWRFHFCCKYPSLKQIFAVVGNTRKTWIMQIWKGQVQPRLECILSYRVIFRSDFKPLNASFQCPWTVLVSSNWVHLLCICKQLSFLIFHCKLITDQLCCKCEQHMCCCHS